MTEALLTTSIPGGRLVSRGKVRDIYETDDALVLVATDRISAFDCVLDPGVPGRGVILTQLSTFWFRRFQASVPTTCWPPTSTPPRALPEPPRAGRPLRARQAAAPDPHRVRRPRLPGRLGLEGVQG